MYGVREERKGGRLRKEKASSAGTVASGTGSDFLHRGANQAWREGNCETADGGYVTRSVTSRGECYVTSPCVPMDTLDPNFTSPVIFYFFNRQLVGGRQEG